MAGVKQFDAEQALESALRVFWAQGFERTSYADLMAATGLNKSSLYNAFGDKQLYDRCLNRYAEVYGKPLQDQLEAPHLVEAIGRFFDRLVARFGRSDLPGGCMSTAAALELGGGDGQIGCQVRAQLVRTERALERRCARAVRDGELPAETDTRALAGLFLAMTRGLSALHRGYGDTEVIEQARTAMMQILRAPPLKRAGSKKGVRS